MVDWRRAWDASPPPPPGLQKEEGNRVEASAEERRGERWAMSASLLRTSFFPFQIQETGGGRGVGAVDTILWGSGIW